MPAPAAKQLLRTILGLDKAVRQKDVFNDSQRMLIHTTMMQCVELYEQQCSADNYIKQVRGMKELMTAVGWKDTPFEPVRRMGRELAAQLADLRKRLTDDVKAEVAQRLSNPQPETETTEPVTSPPSAAQLKKAVSPAPSLMFEEDEQEEFVVTDSLLPEEALPTTTPPRHPSQTSSSFVASEAGPQSSGRRRHPRTSPPSSVKRAVETSLGEATAGPLQTSRPTAVGVDDVMLSQDEQAMLLAQIAKVSPHLLDRYLRPVSPETAKRTGVRQSPIRPENSPSKVTAEMIVEATKSGFVESSGRDDDVMEEEEEEEEDEEVGPMVHRAIVVERGAMSPQHSSSSFVGDVDPLRSALAEEAVVEDE
jgi:hypothetical protein